MRSGSYVANINGLSQVTATVRTSATMERARFAHVLCSGRQSVYESAL